MSVRMSLKPCPSAVLAHLSISSATAKDRLALSFFILSSFSFSSFILFVCSSTRAFSLASLSATRVARSGMTTGGGAGAGAAAGAGEPPMGLAGAGGAGAPPPPPKSTSKPIRSAAGDGLDAGEGALGCCRTGGEGARGSSCGISSPSRPPPRPADGARPGDAAALRGGALKLRPPSCAPPASALPGISWKERSGAASSGNLRAFTSTWPPYTGTDPLSLARSAQNQPPDPSSEGVLNRKWNLPVSGKCFLMCARLGSAPELGRMNIAPSWSASEPFCTS
mmetsp:Transcript_4170/g.12140  ORF Transcript_4170/g.12140 Transcript_4170/m.12140 type:complete len:280 (-) Transcript_4170:305-1144(-)